MRKIFEFVKWFFYITTCVVFVCAANMEISGTETINVNVLWQILLSGFITALLTVILRPFEYGIERAYIIRIIIHYIVLCVVMIILGCEFEWMSLNLAGIIMMVVSVAVVYLLVYCAGYWIDKKQADAINQKLKNKYADEE